MALADFDLAVVGSANADLTVRVERPPRQGETIFGGAVSDDAGGKGLNQATAAARLGLRVAMIGSVGDDAAGQALRTAASDAGVEMLWHHSAEPTGRALVLVDEVGDSTITVIPGANADVGAGVVAEHQTVLANARAILVQHEIPEAGVEAAVAAAGGLVVLNPAPARRVSAEVLGRVDVLVPNGGELAILTGSEVVPSTIEAAADMAARYLEETEGASGCAVVVTLGGAGSVVVRAGVPSVVVPAMPVDVVDATAAGDTFCAALADGLIRGEDVVGAARWATRAAGVTVTRSGAGSSVPYRDEI